VTGVLILIILGGIINLSHLINLITYHFGSKYYFVGSILDDIAFFLLMGSAIPKMSTTIDNQNQDTLTTYYILVFALVIQFYAKALGLNADYFEGQSKTFAGLIRLLVRC
jgi:hypothetical protein